jgi:N-carbamoyl-L-amino-acid hydrolase
MNLKSVTITFLLLLIHCVAVEADDAPTVDGDRLNQTMEEMKTFGGNADGGSDRVAFSSHNREALTYLAGLMKDAGMSTRIDYAGNLVGRLDGSRAGAATLLAGSHIDTVPNGGHYDGIVGVMAAIEVARTLNDQDLRLEHPLEIAVWTNEEGGKTGSRSMNGSVEPSEMALPSLGDRTLGDGIRFLGGNPERLAENQAEPGSIAGYLELHVEQGAILDREQINIGIVEGIVGIKRWYITVDGFANHAGTTPMDQRQDALLAAARFVVAVNEIITAEPGRQVGTVGKLIPSPGAPNVIAGSVEMSLEIRDLDMDKVDRLFAKIEKAAADIGEDSDTTFAFNHYYTSPAAESDERIMGLIEQSAAELGLNAMRMPSGAGHDAQSFKDVSILGMIFVPSRDGISHAPTEYTAPEQITNGANVLLRTLIEMDRLLD